MFRDMVNFVDNIKKEIIKKNHDWIIVEIIAATLKTQFYPEVILG